MLQIGGKHHVLVACFTWHLNAKVPGSQRHEGEGGRVSRASIFGQEMLFCERVERQDRITKGASIADVFPCQSRERRAQRRDRGVYRLDEDRLSV